MFLSCWKIHFESPSKDLSQFYWDLVKYSVRHFGIKVNVTLNELVL